MIVKNNFFVWNNGFFMAKLLFYDTSDYNDFEFKT